MHYDEEDKVYVIEQDVKVFEYIKVSYIIFIIL